MAPLNTVLAQARFPPPFQNGSKKGVKHPFLPNCFRLLSFSCRLWVAVQKCGLAWPSVPADPTQLPSKTLLQCFPVEDKGIGASHSPESLTRLELHLAESERHQDAVTISSLQGKSFQGLQVEKVATWHKMNCWKMVLNTHRHTLLGGRESSLK